MPRYGSAPVDSPRARGQTDLRHRRRRLHRDDAGPAARRGQRDRRGRQHAPGRALGHAARRAPELHAPPGRRARRRGDAELSAGATHIVHCAAIAGVDTVLESPVRTMRVNVIGTYNLLEAAVGTLDSLERFIDFSTSEVFGTHAFRVEEGQVSTIGSVGEARWTYAVSKLAGEHMAHAYHDELGLPAVTVHPFNVFGPGQIGGGAIRAFIENALAAATSSSTATAPRSAPGATSTTWSRARSPASSIPPRRPDLQHRQPARDGDDLRPRAADPPAHRRRRRDHLPAAPLRGRRAADPERREGARGARLRGEGRPRRGPREDDRVVSREGTEPSA